MAKTILLQKNTHGRTKFIELVLEESVVTRTWGLVGGKTQETSNRYGYINKNKSNEFTPEQAAEADYNRLIEKKIKEGYSKFDNIKELPDSDEDLMNFDNLPVAFCCSKPKISIDKETLDVMIRDGTARAFVKENGGCHFIQITSTGEVKIYSRRISNYTAKYPELRAAFEGMCLPPKSLFAAELVVDKSDKFVGHMERFKRFASIDRSDTLNGCVKKDVTKTLKLQEETPVKAVVFNILYFDGECYTNRPYKDNLELINSFIFPDSIRAPEEVKISSYDELSTMVMEHGFDIEGLVIWNQEQNSEITYNGKASRRACYKLKALKEDDVIAYGWQEGTGAKQGKVGSLLIGKYNKELTEIIPMGNVGSGLKIKEGECEVSYWDFPCVIEITYDNRFPTGAYQFPRYIKRHEDKLPKDVVIDEDGF